MEPSFISKPILYYYYSIVRYTYEARGTPGRCQQSTGKQPAWFQEGSSAVQGRIRALAGKDPGRSQRATSARPGGSEVAPARFRGTSPIRGAASRLPWWRLRGLRCGRAPVAPLPGLPSRWVRIRGLGAGWRRPALIFPIQTQGPEEKNMWVFSPRKHVRYFFFGSDHKNSTVGF
jgi:hypothetical protein